MISMFADQNLDHMKPHDIANQRYAGDLRSSGICFRVLFLGSVPIEASVNEMVNELRLQVVMECIRLVAHRAGRLPSVSVNSVVARVIGEVKVENYMTEMMVSTKMIKLIHDNTMIQRHPMRCFSYAAQGEEDTEFMFAYVAKNSKEQDRRCFVMYSQDASKAMKVLGDAILVASGCEPTSNSVAQKSKQGLINSEARLSTDRASTDTIKSGDTPTECTEPASVADLPSQPWYHGVLSREDAHSLLRTEGDFLVRQSTRTPDQYILSGRMDTNQHKHLILLDAEQQVRTRDNLFPSISTLIDYHMKNKVPVVSEGSVIYLVHPVTRR